MTTAPELPDKTGLPDNLDAIRTLPELLRWRVAQTPQSDAYLRYDETAGKWSPVSWQSIAERIEGITVALENLDLPRGSRIGILLPNGLDAVCFDQAALALAMVPVPMHALDNPASIAYILEDSEASVLVAFSMALWQSIVNTGAGLKSLQQIIIVEKTTHQAPAPEGHVVSLIDDWLAQATLSPPPLSSRKPPEPDDLAALVYTSGTTGKPKGVMLTHDNVLENVKATYQRVAPLPEDVFLSFLPLSHTFERTAGYYLPIAAGSCVAHARSVAQLSEDMKTVRPTILISVPRIYERVYTVMKGMLAQSPIKERLFQWAQEIGWRRFCRVQQLPVESSFPGFLDDGLWPLLDKVVAAPVRAQFGGRLRAAVSGGAALSQPIARCFIGLGLPILQGYGMTETSPVVTANALEDNDPATIGRALTGVEVRIGEMQELQVRGRNVMKGYWKRDADTQSAFIDGWLRTGDQAAIENGRIKILGRIKEIIVTSTGEKIAPADLELAITSDPLFEQAYTYGDNRPFIICIVVLSRAGWQHLAQSLGLDPDTMASLQAPEARAAALERIHKLTSNFPYYAQPRSVFLTLEPWTSENSLLTPTLKLKRKNMAAHFSEVIDQLYRR